MKETMDIIYNKVNQKKYEPQKKGMTFIPTVTEKSFFNSIMSKLNEKISDK